MTPSPSDRAAALVRALVSLIESAISQAVKDERERNAASQPSRARGGGPVSAHQCNEIGSDDFGQDFWACGGEFLCPGCEHVVGYCRGCGDALGNLCDDCANDVQETREAYGNGDAEFWFRPYDVPGTT